MQPEKLNSINIEMNYHQQNKNLQFELTNLQLRGFRILHLYYLQLLLPVMPELKYSCLMMKRYKILQLQQ